MRRTRSPRQRPLGPAAEFITPMLAEGVPVVPPGRWLCEIKYDGYRAIAVIDQGEVALWSRAHKPLAGGFGEIVTALRALKCRNAVLDGEIVALDSAGRSRFQLLQAREMGEKSVPLIYCVFDLLHLNGTRTVALPFTERRKLLENFLRDAAEPVRLSPSFAATPADLLEAARKMGLEGIIAKRLDSPYESGRRTGAWLKCKIRGGQEVVIGGFTPPRNSRQYFGAILVGYYQDRKLLYAGKVGTGFNQRTLANLHAQFLQRVRDECPFRNLPMSRRSRFGTGMTPVEMSKVTWVNPDLVAQVEFAEWTEDGLLRQPAFLGLRTDKKAKDVRREAAPSQ